MSLLDGFWGFVLAIGVAWFGIGAWGKLDKTHPRISMALNVTLGLAVVVSILALVLPIFWRQP